jgi:carboxyl-terminal processing protease
MKSNRPLIIAFGALLAIAVCGCVAVTAFLGVSFQDRFAELLQDPATIFEPQISSTEESENVAVPLGEDVDLAALFAPMWEARTFLQQDFVEQPINDEALGQGALDGLTAYLDTAGVNLGNVEEPADAPSAEELAQEAGTPDEVADDFAPFWEAWRKLQFGEVSIVSTYEDIFQVSLRGMVDGLGDQHTGYLTPNELEQSNLSLEGEYEGIGAWVDTTTDVLTIIAPMEGSPAEAAGLLPGDRVIAVDGRDMTGMNGDVVISYILGPAGSQVILTIERDGEPEPFDVTITRGRIFVASVESKMLPDEIGYVQLLTFGSDTASELHQQLEELLAQNPRGIILDLRNNGGGYLDTAVSTTSEFIDDGIVLFEEYGDGTREEYTTLGDGLATDIPLIVLVNGGTASASEILAGAVQDYERGTLVGETTFGKGSVQISRLLSNGEGALRITIARWLTPNERHIHGLGLEPDVVVTLTEEDAAAELDPQLERAIELMLEQTS